MPSSKQPGVVITKGLEGQDGNLDLLQSYFKELKAVTVEPSPPEIDLLTFATCTHYFGVIALEPGQDEDDEDAEGEPEEDSVDAGYIASPPPPSVTSISSATTSRSPIRFGAEDSISNPGRSYIHPTTPEEERVLRWREAFTAQLQEDGGEEEPLLSKGKMRENHNIQSVLDVNIPNPISNDLDDYINWPDDVPSDEDADVFGAQNGRSHMLDDHETDAYHRLDEPQFTRVLGREILEAEQFSSPVREMPEIPTDPNLEAFVYEEAIKFRDTLRAQRIQAYQEASISRPVFIQPPKAKSTPIGIIYLASSQTVDDPMHRGQLNIGIYVLPTCIEERGLASTVKQVVNEAFRDSSCHRVQAIVVDHKTKLHTMELYTSSGFSREGIGRREFFSPVTHEWKDVFYFAILDTDWVYDNGSNVSSVRRRPKSLWDDLLICQQREREELLRMEEKTLKRSNSIETIRNKVPKASNIVNTSKLETSSIANSSSMSTALTSSPARDQSPKRRRLRGKSGKGKEKAGRSRAPSTSTSSSTGTFDTISTISSEWEVPARQAFATPPSNGALAPITPDVSASTSTGRWVVLDVSTKSRNA